MSLICHQCGNDMKPLDWFNIESINEAIGKLPGQEGLWVSPRMTAFGWHPTTTDDVVFPSFFRVPVDSSISLCFNCIEKANPNHKKLLVPVYQTFAAECLYQQDKDDTTQSTDLFDKFQNFQKAISTNCSLCDSHLESEIQAPYFVCRVLNAIASINRFKENANDSPMLKFADSVFGWASNYQWTTCEAGMTTFRVCHKCLQQISPRAYDDFAYGLSGIKNPHQQEPDSEFIITKEAMDQLEKELGSDEARKMLESMPGKVSIIFPGTEPSNN